MNTFILIMVLSSGSYTTRHTTTLTVEFSTFASCEAARKWTADHAKEHLTDVVSQGCFKK